MKALICTRYGTPDDLEIADIADPAPAPGEVVSLDSFRKK